MSIKRKPTKEIKIGSIKIGENNPIAVQSMLNAASNDIGENISQAILLQEAGCDIVRIAVPDKEALKTIFEIKKHIEIPLVADIHFDFRLAIEAIEAGADKIRINPGNIGSDDRVKEVVSKCKVKNVPIRVGVNSGSLEKHILAKYGFATPEALCESAMYHIQLIEKYDYNNIVISIKSSDVVKMVESYELISERYSYPLHLGVTEAGTERMGIIKSSMGIGSLLIKGIGDTIRVSLTAEPIKEIYAAKDILKGLRIGDQGADIISCPTCGRTKIDIISLTNEVENRLKSVNKNISVAVMGCVVNGPGEAREADYGIAGGDGVGIIFRKGILLKKVPEEELLDELIKIIESE